MVTIYFDWNSRNEVKPEPNLVKQQNNSILQKHKPKIIEKVPEEVKKLNHNLYHQQYYLKNKEKIRTYTCRTYERNKHNLKSYYEKIKRK